MAVSMFQWRVGLVPVDVDMVEKGVYRFRVGKAIEHEARMVERGNWTLLWRRGPDDYAPVMMGLASLRACVAHAFEVPADIVKGQKSPTGG